MLITKMAAPFELISPEIDSILLLLAVALIWGITNPLMRKGGEGIEKVDTTKTRFPFKFVYELCFLLTNWKYLVPYLINQSGSVLFLLALTTADLTLAIPFTNALSFVFTAITGRFLGEQSLGYRELLGMLFVVSGVLLCTWSKTGA